MTLYPHEQLVEYIRSVFNFISEDPADAGVVVVIAGYVTLLIMAEVPGNCIYDIQVAHYFGIAELMEKYL